MARIERLVIHCTAMPPEREVTSVEVRRWYTALIAEGGREWRQVGYSDIIHLDGEVEQLVDNNEDAEFDGWEIPTGAKGCNASGRHVIYVGGVTADERTPPIPALHHSGLQ